MTNTEDENVLNLKLANRHIERVKSYRYLGQKVEATENNYLKADLKKRISLARAIFRSHLPNTIKAKTFDQYMLPVLTQET